MLADIPGVTVQQVTDVTGQADVAVRFPFTDGVTEILLNASTRQFVGYVRGDHEGSDRLRAGQPYAGGAASRRAPA